MLATASSLPPADVEDRWAFEVKQDGRRAMAYLPGGRGRTGDLRWVRPAGGCGCAPDLERGIAALRGDLPHMQPRPGLTVVSPTCCRRVAAQRRSPTGPVPAC